MYKKLKLTALIIFFFILSVKAYAVPLKDILVKGNLRIPIETIKMFSNVKVGQEINEIDLNQVLKDLYNTNYFNNVSIEIVEDQIVIYVDEAPLIENITFDGIKANKIQREIDKNLSLKSRSSYSDFLLIEDTKKIENILKDLGYYYSNIETTITELDNNKININYKIDLGNKSRIKKISFIGNKIYKNRKLRSVIISEQYKFWKIISGKKFLNQNLINLDERLLKNFYLNKGYYNVEINSSFAKLVDENEFEIIFNIDAKEKVYFNNLKLDLPVDFERENYSKINDLFQEIKGEHYSINTVEKILQEIEVITINDQYLSVKATVEEIINSNKLDLVFKIEETEKYYVSKINIFGNKITQESVIRNQLEIDEGDPFNEILHGKTINNLRSLNIFRNVKSEIVDNEVNDTKKINIIVEEKPTGEIFAGAGAGTNGTTLTAGIKENNYLGKGLRVKADGTLTSESFKGQFSLVNPNFKNSDKSIFFNVQALETDRLESFGYKTNKTGFDVGTGFEYLNDLNLSLATRTYFEKIETNNTASARQKKQEGNYWDTFINIGLDYDKRNQKFKTTDGFRSNYDVDIPIVSDNNTIKNTYSYKYYTDLFEENISSFSIFLQAANSYSGDDIKLSERLYVPSSRLRGFERGKVGPKDGNDFIGGNYVSALNLSTTVPQILPNLQEVDFSLFFDAANIWGVDYDSSLADSSKIRSSIGIGVDWFTVIGPLNFSLTETISKADTDITESFRFNIGTSF